MLSWKLQAFDYSGNTIGSIQKQLDGHLSIDGTPDAFACCLPDLARIHHGFTAPEPVARQLYEEFLKLFPRPEAPQTWAALKSDPDSTLLVQRWLALAHTARTAAAVWN